MPSICCSRIFASIWMNHKSESSKLFLDIIIWGSGFKLKYIVRVVKFLVGESFELNFLFQSFGPNSFVFERINIFGELAHLLVQFVSLCHLLYKYYEEDYHSYQLIWTWKFIFFIEGVKLAPFSLRTPSYYYIYAAYLGPPLYPTSFVGLYSTISAFNTVDLGPGIAIKFELVTIVLSGFLYLLSA